MCLLRGLCASRGLRVFSGVRRKTPTQVLSVASLGYIHQRRVAWLSLRPSFQHASRKAIQVVFHTSAFFPQSFALMLARLNRNNRRLCRFAPLPRRSYRTADKKPVGACHTGLGRAHQKLVFVSS